MQLSFPTAALLLARLANAPTRQPENVSPHQLRD
jgi:hypothetical protein